jgi:hypothetical protein
MVGFNLSATSYTPLTAAEKALAKEHRLIQKFSSLMFSRLKSECEDERAEKFEELKILRQQLGEGPPSTEWQQAVGITIRVDEWELGQYRNPPAIPQVPAFNLSNRAFSFNAATNTINIGIGSRIQMNGYFLEVLENSVVARNSDGSFSQQGASSAVALNSLLRGIGVNATWGYDAHRKQTTMNFLNALGVDTSQPFFINGTQFELQDNKIRTVGETAQQDLQFWGFEGLNRLVARAYAQNLFNPATD